MFKKGMSIYAIVTLVGLFVGSLGFSIWASYNLATTKDNVSNTRYYFNILWLLLGVFFIWVAYASFVDCYKTGCPTLGTVFLVTDVVDWMFGGPF